MKNLVIGGAGFIGSNLVERLLKNNEEVHVIDDLSRKGSENLKKKLGFDKEYSFHKINISDKKKVFNFFKNRNFENIFLLAGQVAVTTSLTNPRLDLNSNVIGCFNILDSLRQRKSKSKIIFSSTNKVYGKLEGLKTLKSKDGYTLKNYPKGINESFPVDFATPYGCSKGAADFYCQDYNKTFKLNTVVMRQSCIYGRMQLGIEDQGWIAWMIIAALLKRKIKIYGDGMQVRDALYADDLVDVYLKASKSKKSIGKVYNIGGGYKNKISVIGLIRLLEIKLNMKINYKFYPERKGDQKVFISNNSKAHNELNWMPKTGLSKGLNKIISWTEENLDFIKKINKI